MRVFHGLYNIAGIPANMARAERELGIDSTSVCFPSNYTPDILEPSGFQTSDLMKRYERYADGYDVFVFHFGSSLTFENLSDIPLLKQKGKTIIFYFHGCDIRQSKETIKKYEFSACKECWPPLCNHNRDKALEVALNYGDQIWVSTPDLLEFVPGSKLFGQPIDLKHMPYIYRNAEGRQNRKTVRILHAPTNASFKGTKYVTAAIDQLKSEGLPVELVLLQGVPHADVIHTLKEVDLGVDQLLGGAYGMFSLEMLAAGIPVMCYIRDDLSALYPEKPPIASGSPSTICDVMRDMVQKTEIWQDYSIRGRRYVEDYHDAKRAAQRSIDVYQSLRRASLAA